ncbi:M4 family metallopeptidase [Rhizobium sp. BK251]|uniref:M4 family metallopeptidase n=1 Tax=Rhizobium sp. BK251 TaxID=2512125 RepID=UPI0010ED782A|nr:M4 family metallopeptidase [Rhizobium sp. BK251]TCL76150.1 thermolysin metallopeptidase-like protein [Rhizobium sp. BK251]
MMASRCGCFIIPRSVIDRFAEDETLPESTRQAFVDTAAIEPNWRHIRQAHNTTPISGAQLAVSAATTLTPSLLVFDCKGTTSLPGNPVSNPKSSADQTARRAFEVTKDVARFYAKCFGRNSVDGKGMSLLSSIHYGVKYNNAFWDGSQMTYGDGDGRIFIDFTGSDDVIAHELTHGVTQFTAALKYTNEPGGLNESISDVFGTIFRQWRAKQEVDAADWLIGAEILGPAARTKGFRCLRDLSDPGGKHCLSPQPAHYSQYKPGSDPHDSSGIPNHAFYLAAKGIGGRSWTTAGKIWYAALTSPKATKGMSFSKFATLTRQAAKTLSSGSSDVYNAVDDAWTQVGL